jgi:chromosomal replication initiator protein
MTRILGNTRNRIDVVCEPCNVHPFKPSQRVLTISEIIRKACDFLGVSVEKIQSKRRDLYIVDARRMLSGVLYYDTGYRLTKSEIGKFMGGRDHTTIIHHLRTLTTICETEPDYKERYYQLHLFVYGNDRYFKY